MPYFSGPNGIREVADAGERFQQSFNTARRGKLLSDFFTNGQTDLGALARLDPEAAQQIQAQQKQSGLAKMFADLYAAPEDQRPQGIAALLVADPKMGMEAAKMFDPRFNKTQAEQFTLGPGSKRFGPDGKVIAEVPFAPASAQYVDVPDGQGGAVKMLLDPRTQKFSMPQFPGSGQQAPQQDVQGNPIAINYDGPPEDRAAFEQLVAADSMQPFAPGQYSVKLPDRVLSPGAGRLGYAPPKRDEKFQSRQLSPEEIQRVGLPVGTVAFTTESGKPDIVNKPRDLPTGGGQVIDNGDGTTTYIPAGKISEGERNASGFYSRMVEANAEMKRLESAGYDPANRRDYYTAGGEFLNPLASSEGQQYRQAQNNWLRANLRKESGAAIGVEEMDQERKNYFPIPGDTPETVAQKMRNRTTTERAMRQAAGGAMPIPQSAAKPQKPAASGGLSPQEQQELDALRARFGRK